MNKNYQDLNKYIDYRQGGILSKVLLKTEAINATLFSMAKGTEISEHTSTKEGIVYVIEGEGIFFLKDKKFKMHPGAFIHLEKNAVHAIKAKTNLTFLLSLS